MPQPIRIPDVAGKVVALLGLGRTGSATAAALEASGAIVWAWDDNEQARAALPTDMIVDLAKANWSRPEMLVMSPGIPHTHPAPHPVAALAKEAGKPLLGDIELLYRATPRQRYVGVTGTNGKSTTTTLIAHILRQGGKHVAVGGNLGAAALSLEPLPGDGIYVLELSSYQLELTPTPICDVAILLNVTPDHLSRHGGMDGYIDAKALILRPKGRGSIGVLGVDDQPCRDLFARLQDGGRKLIPISVEREAAGGVDAVNGVLIDRTGKQPEHVLDLKSIATLPGSHNWQNAAAAYVAAKAMGLDRAAIVAGLQSYPGLAHRQELIATVAGVRYVNDSKATNADAAAKALACYENIHWIIGGRAKEGGLAGLDPLYRRVRHAYIIGECANDFAKQLRGKLPFTQCGTLDKAVAAAHGDAKTGAVVLLSPACASWDQYPNFEARGDHFRQLVLALGGRGAA
ncbi:UDP-N-acetylmuramoyl-L-alanine--D-glutamate ligase [Dongia deserti]|uniref:UDP-N-acetylmuramoyl-L-alanine--D-glutamate ligase n=1 Tax=Dongia deserti TaxID=2268030 RepID=UPI000E65DEE0|nr:UDP-N-acetylmuramoyl-L-alanine--D-glutamate ligase [Dongia deserti]